MDFFVTYGADPWGRPIVTHISWGRAVGVGGHRPHVSHRALHLHGAVRQPQTQDDQPGRPGGGAHGLARPHYPTHP